MAIAGQFPRFPELRLFDKIVSNCQRLLHYCTGEHPAKLTEVVMGDVVPVPLAEDTEDHLSAAPSVSHGIPRPQLTRPTRVMWPYLIGVVAFHLLLPLAFIPWLFSWTGLLLIPIGNYVSVRSASGQAIIAC